MAFLPRSNGRRGTMPTGSERRLARLAEKQLGLFTRAQAARAGLPVRTINRRVRSRRWDEVHAGVYRIAGCPSSPDQQVLAAVLAAGAGAAASHRSAGALWHLRGVAAPEPEVVVCFPRDPRPSGVRIYRTRTLRPEDVTTLGPVPITTPARTLLDLSFVLNSVSLEDALDDALQRKLVTRRQLEARLAGAQHGVSGVEALRRLLALRAEGHLGESGFENRLRRVLVSGGLPAPVPQFVVRDQDGSFIARVDLAYPAAQLAVEADGYAFHSGRRAFERDRDRQNGLINAGWRVLRVTPSRLDRDPAGVKASVARALGVSVRPRGR